MAAAPQRLIKCIFCSQEFTGNGVRGSYKRHLETKHIRRYAHQCKACLAIFPPETDKAEIKRHCKDCTPEDRGAKPILMEPNLFGCQFTGACFPSKQNFVDHVLSLSNTDELERLPPCYIRKLHGLLEHATYRTHVESLSRAILGDPDGWRTLKWDQDTAAEASKELEYFDAATYSTPYSVAASKIHTFLAHLLFKPERMAHSASHVAQHNRTQQQQTSNVLVHPPMLLPSFSTPQIPPLESNLSLTLNGFARSPSTHNLSHPQQIAGQWTSSQGTAGPSLTEQFEPPLPSSIQYPSYNWLPERSDGRIAVKAETNKGATSEQRKRCDVVAPTVGTDADIHQGWQRVLPFQNANGYVGQETLDQEPDVGAALEDMYFNYQG